ncbi:hypothetical protein PT974_08811 [Cladobotryum mycophilum]|uniref:Thioester reductase (TE) domain-containing protein n=1 Tax=Cladobotryum mycophilum TaxID=491253 RepID=A0ABR0SFD1_9HYPO
MSKELYGFVPSADGGAEVVLPAAEILVPITRSHVFTSLLLVVVFVVLYGVRLNWVLTHTPKAAAEWAVEPIKAEHVRETYERIRREGRDLWEDKFPPRLERRYIVVGGSGEVCWRADDFGSLGQGHPPEAIRNLDARPPFREEFTQGPAAKVQFVQTDVTSEAATLAAYMTPWPDAISRLPLTVFHTAAVIRPYERLPMFYHRSSRVNVAGTAHSLAAARRAGATVFVFTSSVNAGWRAVRWLQFVPWARDAYPRNFVQVITERDFFEPMWDTGEFPTTYARSKAEAERLVCGASDGGMRTGVIRPGCAIYGGQDANLIARMLGMGTVPTWMASVVQNWVHVRNVTLAHMKFEEALLGEHADKVAARPYMVTDKGPALRHSDSYTMINAVSKKSIQIINVPPVLLLLFGFALEGYCVALMKLPC